MGFLDELKRLTHPYEDEMEDDYDEDEDVYEDEEEPEDVEPCLLYTSDAADE